MENRFSVWEELCHLYNVRMRIYLIPYWKVFSPNMAFLPLTLFRSIDMIKNVSNEDFLYTCIYRKVFFAQKILLLAKYWVTKSTFSPKQKTKVVFFLSALTLNWRHSWKSASAKHWCSVLSNMRDTKCALWCGSGRCAQLWHHPERAYKNWFYKIVYWKKCAFWMIWPKRNILL